MKNRNSTLEMIFWSTIVVLALIYIWLQFLASSHIRDDEFNKTKQTTVIPPQIATVIKEFIVDDDSIKKYLEDNATAKYLKSNFNSSIDNINATIDRRVDRLFAPVYNNIDSFLDFHYSVIGEYTELGLAATGKIEEGIRDRLFGSQFNNELSDTTMQIKSRFASILDMQQKSIENHIMIDIDKKLNNNILDTLKKDINSSVSTQKNKIATLLGVGISYKMIMTTIGSKIVAKLSSKMIAKGVIKGGSKLGAVGIGAATGAVCGPAAIICSPILAAAAWFGTDAMLATGDEYLNRDEFKQEIVQSIDQQKRRVKEEYKKIYTHAFEEESSEITEKYREAKVKKRIRKKVKVYVSP